ncbi:MAG: multidrug effflux MFS transporter [Immundisolibacterales bacterium]|nr:multidrug effflux MFS transporter [Immundisolibacterales bacterium]
MSAVGETAGERLRAGEFIPLVALHFSLVALAIDGMLPALPELGHDLGVTRPNDVQYVIVSLFFGLGLGQVLFGPLSDRIGRKPAIYAGLAVFMAGCVVSVVAPTFEAMIAGRVLQGVGVAAPRIVMVALVRDQYGGRPMARIMSFAMAVFILVPAVAPALGLLVLRTVGWRSIFIGFFVIAAIAFVWLLLRQPETLPAARRRPFSLRTIARAVREVLGIRAAVGYTIATGFAFSPFVAYLSSAPQMFEQGYGVRDLFVAWFAILALVIGAASIVNGRLVMRYGMRRLSAIAATAIALVSTAAWLGLFSVDGLFPFWLFMAYFLFVFMCVGLLVGNLNALAMEPLGHIAGVGAAVVASLATLIAVPLGGIVGQSFDGTLYAQVGAFAVFGAGMLVAIWWAGGSPRRRGRP